MSTKKQKKAQQRILTEIKGQLHIKAKKLGIEDKYSELNFETMKQEAARKILDDLNSERLNLEYELFMKGKLDKESTIKLEKVQTYINKAKRAIDKYARNVKKIDEKAAPDREKAKAAAKKLAHTPRISVHR
jgi:hypothetical protein